MSQALRDARAYNARLHANDGKPVDQVVLGLAAAIGGAADEPVERVLNQAWFQAYKDAIGNDTQLFAQEFLAYCPCYLVDWGYAITRAWYYIVWVKNPRFVTEGDLWRLLHNTRARTAFAHLVVTTRSRVLVESGTRVFRRVDLQLQSIELQSAVDVFRQWEGPLPDDIETIHQVQVNPTEFHEVLVKDEDGPEPALLPALPGPPPKEAINGVALARADPRVMLLVLTGEAINDPFRLDQLARHTPSTSTLANPSVTHTTWMSGYNLMSRSSATSQLWATVQQYGIPVERAAATPLSRMLAAYLTAVEVALRRSSAGRAKPTDVLQYLLETRPQLLAQLRALV